MSRFLQLALTLCVLYFVIQAFAPQTIGETARRKLQNDLQLHYAGYEVSVGRGHYDSRVGLAFDDIRITQSNSSPPELKAGLASPKPRKTNREIVHIDRLTVMAEIDPEQLLHQNLPLDTNAIVLDGLTVNTWLLDDDQLSITKLWPLPKFGPDAPKMIVRKTRVNLFGDPNSNRPIIFDLDDIAINNQRQTDGKLLPRNVWGGPQFGLGPSIDASSCGSFRGRRNPLELLPMNWR